MGKKSLNCLFEGLQVPDLCSSAHRIAYLCFACCLFSAPSTTASSAVESIKKRNARAHVSVQACRCKRAASHVQVNSYFRLYSGTWARLWQGRYTAAFNGIVEALWLES